MNANSFRAFGVLTLLLDVGLLIIVISEAIDNRLGPQSATVVGIGLLFLRKWAAIYFSLATSAHGSWLILSSIEEVPFPWNLLFICLGISLLLPALVTLRVWSQLSWGGKWFF